jgi:hypothetical protein
VEAVDDDDELDDNAGVHEEEELHLNSASTALSKSSSAEVSDSCSVICEDAHLLQVLKALDTSADRSRVQGPTNLQEVTSAEKPNAQASAGVRECAPTRDPPVVPTCPRCENMSL